MSCFVKTCSQGWALALLILLISIPLIIVFRYLLQEMIGPRVWGFPVYYPPYTLKFYFQDNLYFAVLYSCFGFVYFIIHYTQYSIKRQAELSMAVKEAELSLLKSQLNPHFLFNSLNSIYTLIHRKDEKALPAVEQLSSLLRYALYEHREKVEIETEIEYLKNYINLQRLRFDESTNIAADLEDMDGSLLISPHLLITFSENAFKHGDLSDSRHPLVINARTEGNMLFFHVSNSMSNVNKPASGGIGLANLQRRLQLLYAGKYHLNVQKTGNHFSVDLSISL